LCSWSSLSALSFLVRSYLYSPKSQYNITNLSGTNAHSESTTVRESARTSNESLRVLWNRQLPSSVTANLIEASGTSSFITSSAVTNFTLDMVINGTATECLGFLSGSASAYVTLIVLLAPGPSLSSVTDFHPVTTLTGAPAASASAGVATSVTTVSISSTTVVPETLYSTVLAVLLSSTTITTSSTGTINGTATVIITTFISSVPPPATFQTEAFTFTCTDTTECQPWTSTCINLLGC
jgi:hypothetical protein